MVPDSRPWRPVCSVVLFVALVAVTRCTAPPEPLTWQSTEALIAEEFPEVPSVTTAELARTLRAGEQPVLLLDVREPDEFAVSHLENAYRIDSSDDATVLVVRSNPTGLVVAYCSVGYRSAAIVAELRRRGHENVVNLEGSIFAWANQGHPVYRNGIPVEEVHPYSEAWGKLLKSELRFRGPQE